MIRRDLPPCPAEMVAPRTVINCGLTVLLARSVISLMGRVSLLITSWTIGTSEASYCRMFGGVAPCGRPRRMDCIEAVICAMASLIAVPGWK
jgi:hypothetical protein